MPKHTNHDNTVLAATPRTGLGGTGQAGAEGWVLLPSDAVTRLAAAELLAQKEISPTLRDSLLSATSGANNVLKRIRVWVDLTALHLLDSQNESVQWRQAALKYLIARQASYSMLKEIFKASRAEVSGLRKALNAEFPNTKPKAIPTGALNSIYKVWGELNASDASVPDRWVQLGERFPEYPMASLYAAIVIESSPRARTAGGREKT